MEDGLVVVLGATVVVVVVVVVVEVLGGGAAGVAGATEGSGWMKSSRNLSKENESSSCGGRCSCTGSCWFVDTKSWYWTSSSTLSWASFSDSSSLPHSASNSDVGVVVGRSLRTGRGGDLLVLVVVVGGDVGLGDVVVLVVLGAAAGAVVVEVVVEPDAVVVFSTAAAAAVVALVVAVVGGEGVGAEVGVGFVTLGTGVVVVGAAVVLEVFNVVDEGLFVVQVGLVVVDFVLTIGLVTVLVVVVVDAVVGLWRWLFVVVEGVTVVVVVVVEVVVVVVDVLDGTGRLAGTRSGTGSATTACSATTWTRCPSPSARPANSSGRSLFASPQKMAPQQRSGSPVGAGPRVHPGGTAPHEGSWHCTSPSKQKHIRHAPIPASSSPWR